MLALACQFDKLFGKELRVYFCTCDSLAGSSAQNNFQIKLYLWHKADRESWIWVIFFCELSRTTVWTLVCGKERNEAWVRNVFNLYFLFVYFCPALYLCLDFRYKQFAERLAQLEEAEGAFDYFTLSYRSFGIQRRSDNGLVLREWAPGTEAVFLTGDFSKRHHAENSVCYIQVQTLRNGQIYGAKYKWFIVSKETGFNFRPLMLEMLSAFAGWGIWICGVCIEWFIKP